MSIQDSQALDGQQPQDLAEEQLRQQVVMAQLDAVLMLTRKAAGSGSVSAAEAKDFAQASLLIAQSLVVLDPSLSQGGTPLAHDVALEQTRQAGMVAAEQSRGQTAIQIEHVRGANQLRHAKELAAAPTPAKQRSVTVRRDGHGRPAGYDIHG